MDLDWYMKYEPFLNDFMWFRIRDFVLICEVLCLILGFGKKDSGFGSLSNNL